MAPDREEHLRKVLKEVGDPSGIAHEALDALVELRKQSYFYKEKAMFFWERREKYEAELSLIKGWLIKEITDEEFYSGGPRPAERLHVLQEVKELFND